MPIAWIEPLLNEELTPGHAPTSTSVTLLMPFLKGTDAVVSERSSCCVSRADSEVLASPSSEHGQRKMSTSATGSSLSAFPRESTLSDLLVKPLDRPPAQGPTRRQHVKGVHAAVVHVDLSPHNRAAGRATHRERPAGLWRVCAGTDATPDDCATCSTRVRGCVPSWPYRGSKAWGTRAPETPRSRRRDPGQPCTRRRPGRPRCPPRKYLAAVHAQLLCMVAQKRQRPPAVVKGSWIGSLPRQPVSGRDDHGTVVSHDIHGARPKDHLLHPQSIYAILADGAPRCLAPWAVVRKAQSSRRRMRERANVRRRSDAG